MQTEFGVFEPEIAEQYPQEYKRQSNQPRRRGSARSKGSQVSPIEAKDLHCDDSLSFMMKTCPVCKTHVFEDMDTCYNCMYAFGSNPALELRLEIEAQKRSIASGTATVSAPVSTPPAPARTPAPAPTIMPANVLASDAPDPASAIHAKAALQGFDAAQSAMKSLDATKSREMKPIDAVPSPVAKTPDTIPPQMKPLEPTPPVMTALDPVPPEMKPIEPISSITELPLVQQDTSSLFDSFLVEFHGFLSKFLLDREIDIK